MNNVAPKQRWCTVCKSATHFTADCWGPGTVSIIPDPVYIHAMADSKAIAPPLKKMPIAASIGETMKEAKNG